MYTVSWVGGFVDRMNVERRVFLSNSRAKLVLDPGQEQGENKQEEGNLTTSPSSTYHQH